MLKIDEDKPVELDQRVIDGLTTLDKVMDNLNKKNINSLSNPPKEEMPEMPPDLGALAPKQLGELFSHLLAWQNFVASELAFSQALELQAKNKASYVKAKLKKEGVGKEEIELHPVMLDVIIELQEAKQRTLLTETLRKNLSKNLGTVSRSIELRRIEFEGHGREAGMDRSFIEKLRLREKRAEGVPWKEREE